MNWNQCYIYIYIYFIRFLNVALCATIVLIDEYKAIYIAVKKIYMNFGVFLDLEKPKIISNSLTIFKAYYVSFWTPLDDSLRFNELDTYDQHCKEESFF